MCGLPGFPGGGLAYARVGDFHQRYGLGHGDKESRGWWGFTRQVQAGWGGLTWIQGSGLVSNGIGGFSQRYGPGHGNQTRNYFSYILSRLSVFVLN